MLIEYFTKYTDYMANQKIEIKDMCIIKEFLEPFKWDFHTKYKVWPKEPVTTQVVVATTYEQVSTSAAYPSGGWR